MTRKKLIVSILLATLALGATGGLLLAQSGLAGGTSVAALATNTHFHGIAVDPRDADRLYLATHHGLFVVGPDGKAERISESRDDFMGFTPHPSDPERLFASGHPSGGGNLGFIGSTDGGRTWSKLSDGVGGTVDFHQMDVSKADARVVYGVHRGLQRSTDGGRSWRRVGPALEGLIGIAASSRDPDTLYAATQQGLIRSSDGGKSWQIAHTLRRPVTMVHVTDKGEVYAFLVGSGLIRAAEGALSWQAVSNGFGDDYVLHFAVARTDARRMYAVTINSGSRAQAVVASRDGGASWARLGSE